MIKLSVGRPVAVAMLYFALAFLGIRAWQNIPIELMPDAQLPRLTVSGSWPGASPETVEAFLTSPLEAQIQLVEGVEKVTSRSSENSANIEVHFARDTDMEFARLDLSERLYNLEERVLPPGVGRVTVSPYVPEEFSDAQRRAVLEYTFTGRRTHESLREHLTDNVVPDLSQVEGVGRVFVYGGRDRLLEVELDKSLMAAMGVSSGDVSSKLGSLDLVREAGAIREGERQWTVTIRNRPATAQDIRDAIVKSDGGRIVRISDIATVRHTFEEIRSHYRINGQPAVSMYVYKEIGTNSVQVADRAKERVAEVARSNPPNTRFILDRDESRQIRRQMSDQRSRAAISVIVIFGVLILFLGSVRTSLVIFATIAFSVLIAINVIYFAGYTMNQLTLMGLAAGFGLYVDNSIVVLENIYRRWQQGHSRREAIVDGATHVVLPIMAATATTLIVYAPFLYLTGEQRIYYLPLAVIIVLSVLGSVIVAFTFIPALVGKLLPERDPRARDADRRPPFYQRFYRGLVGSTLKWPWVTVAVPILLLGGSYYLFDNYVTKGRIWGGWGRGESTHIDVHIRLPRGSDIDRTDMLTRYFEERLGEMPEVKQFVTNVSPTSSHTRVTFPEELERTNVPVRIKEQLFAYSLGFARAEVRVYGYGPSFYGGGGGGGGNYSIQVLGYNYEEVRRIAEDLGGRLERFARVRDVDTNASSGYWGSRDRATEFAVVIRRDIAARHGMPVSRLVSQISSAVYGQVGGSTIKMGGDEIRYDVKLEGNRAIDLHELRKTLVLNPAGDAIRLGELVDIEEKNVLSTIRREDQQYERTVRYEFRGPYKLGDVTHKAVIEATSVPPGYQVRKAEGYGWWSDDDKTQIYMILAVAIFLVYMVTSALFESLRLPLCVLLTVPMALIGVFLLFFYADAHFTREAYIGVIMMGGIVVNNAILLVDHINRVRREHDLALKPAILRGTMERVRPILMTSATTITALLPLVLFSPSANANIWNAIAYTLIGGLLASTFLVLTVTPALYLLFERGRDGVFDSVDFGGMAGRGGDAPA